MPATNKPDQSDIDGRRLQLQMVLRKARARAPALAAAELRTTPRV